MNPTASRRFLLPLLKPSAWAAIAILALAGCGQRLAGTSVGTGNPTEIQVGFRDSAGAPVVLTGVARVYASTQIPVEGYRPSPLLEYRLNAASHADLKASDFAGLPDSMWSTGSESAGDRTFNIVVTGEGTGLVLRDFVYHRAAGDFALRKDDVPVWNDSRTVAALPGRLTALVDFKGSVDTTSFSTYRDYHLFIYGTGFSAKIQSGIFTLSKVPSGTYKPFLISLPNKDHLVGNADSTDVFETRGTFSPSGTNTLDKGDYFGRVPLPDSLIQH